MTLIAALRSRLPVAGQIAAARKPCSPLRQPGVLRFSRSLEQQRRGGATVPPAAVPRSAVGVAPPAVMVNPVFKDSWVVLAHDTDSSRIEWAKALRATGLQVLVYPDDIPADSSKKVEFAIVWGRHPELWKQCPDLKAIQVLGAGVDSLLTDPDLPRNIPLLRVIDPLMSERMATWIMWAVINAQRKCDAYWRAQHERQWAKDIENHRSIDNSELRVGIMGLGVMGSAAADILSEAGYHVLSWTRTPHDHEGVTCFSGAAELQEFVSTTDVLVCLLPLTSATRGIINAKLLSWLPCGSTLVNAARGAHVVEQDLLAALDEGQLDGAILDVFDTEPLPEDSPLWTHPRIRVFPHVSAMTNIDSAIEQIVHNRECMLSGTPAPRDLTVDWAIEY